MWRSMLFIVLLLVQPMAYAETLVLGVYPYLNMSEILRRFDPLANYLSEALSVPIEISVSHDYAEHIELVGKGFIDIAYLGPVSYVTLIEEYDSQPLLGQLEIKGSSQYRGAILVKNNSDIHSLSDLKGKTFAFGDPKSTMSHIVPHYMLLKAGVTDDDLARYDFLGNHDSVALSIVLGQYDAGAVKSNVADRYIQNNLRILEHTPYFSEHVFVTKKGLEPDLQTQIEQAFVDLNQVQNLKVLTHIKKTITGFVSVQESDYDNLREILATLRAADIID